LVGSIVSEDSLFVNFLTQGNIPVTIPKNQISSVEKLYVEYIDGEYILHDPNNTRLFFAPTARPIKAGNGYFSIYELFFPSISVGIADVISLTGGVTIFPGASSQLIYFAPKITALNYEKVSAALGVFYLTPITGINENGFGIVYALTTFGDEKASVTTGAGWGFAGADFADIPVFLFGGEIRLSDSFKFITENWIPASDDGAVVSFGIRFFGRKLAADLGFIRPTGAGYNGFPFIPWLGFAYNF
jgi:hypothetical protein